MASYENRLCIPLLTWLTDEENEGCRMTDILSVIIVTYNSADTIIPCLESITRSAGTPLKVELIIVDNNSPDATVPLVEEKFPAALIVRNSENIGFASAANQGAERASGNLLFFLNPDTVLPRDFIPALHRILNQYPASILGFQFIGFDAKPRPSVWRTPSLWTLFAEGFLPYNVSRAFVTRKYSRPSGTDMVSGGCMLCPRELFQALSGFDPSYFLYYEDVDFCLRARKAGYKILFVPSIKIQHYGRRSFGDDESGFFTAYYSGKLMFCSHHFTPFRYALARKIILAGVAVKMAAYRLAAALRGSPRMKALAQGHLDALRRIRSI